ncbi:MAG: 23S rRNA (adenine(2503)-C(2))-methyltransferase RlmN [Gammaproteobacteria bacterium]|nr:23S rRNA (adenine(2503)-C(2))-methyltransferase RlmN [Gammaproteobacteria bacterium]
MSVAPVNLLGLPRRELEGFFARLGEKPYRAKQLMRWLYRDNVLDPEGMTDFSQGLRQQLAEQAVFALPSVTRVQQAKDGTIKWLISVGGGQDIETVFIPEASRGTLCVSSQVGCAMDCPFCATGRQGFNRNLSAAEIIGQVLVAQRRLAEQGTGSRITNIVFMGMGEPLANFRELVPACNLLTDDLAFALSRRRVTVSTSGLVPQIYKLAEATNVALAISLHASNDVLRNELVPINRRHPIEELLQACWDYAEATNARAITFEYIMLKGVNDSVAEARDLARLLKGRPAKVNLIPYNPVEAIVYERSTQTKIDQFRQVLLDNNIMTVTRRPRGDDIDAACGQLAGRLDNKVRVPLGVRLGEKNSAHSVKQA